MINFLYLICFALIVSIVFSIIEKGDTRDKILYGAKIFAQFVLVSIVLAWVFYFLPW